MRFVIPDQGHIVNMLAPIDINGVAASARTSDLVDMRYYDHIDIIIKLGVTGAASTVTVYEADDATPSNETAIAFSVYKEETAGGDTLGVRTAVTSAGFATSTENGIFYVISIDAAQLTDGYPFVRVKLSDPSAATLVDITGILSGARYQGNPTPTAIT